METQKLQVTMPTGQSNQAALQNSAIKQPPTVAEIQDWIASYLAELLEVDPDEVNITIPFDRYGLDSSAAVGMTGDLEEWLGRDLDPTVVYDYPTIQGLAKYLSSDFFRA